MAFTDWNTQNLALPTVPARVGELHIINRGPVPPAMMWQRWKNSWSGEDIDVRWAGDCIVCGRNVYRGVGDPRGPIGDNTLWPLELDELGETVIRTCSICANEHDKYLRAQLIVQTRGAQACAVIAWPDADPAATVEEEDWTTYRIVRKFFDDEYDDEVIETGLTLAEAQAHCNDPQTSSRTATDADKVALTDERGAWFDSWTSE